MTPQQGGYALAQAKSAATPGTAMGLCNPKATPHQQAAPPPPPPHERSGSAPPPTQSPTTHDTGLYELDPVPNELGKFATLLDTLDGAFVDMYDNTKSWNMRSGREWVQRDSLDSAESKVFKFDHKISIRYPKHLILSHVSGHLSRGYSIKSIEGRTKTEGASVNAGVNITPLTSWSAGINLGASNKSTLSSGQSKLELTYYDPKLTVELNMKSTEAHDGGSVITAVVCGCVLKVYLEVDQKTEHGRERGGKFGVNVAPDSVKVDLGYSNEDVKGGETYNVRACASARAFYLTRSPRCLFTRFGMLSLHSHR